MNDFYTAETLAEKLGVFAGTIKRWAREGRLPYYKFGNKYRFDKIKIEKWIARREKNEIKNKE